MKKALPLFVLLCASLAWFGFRRQASPPDLSTPKSTVRTFVAALIAKDPDNVAACVQGAQAGAELKTLLQQGNGPTARVTGGEVKDILAEADGENAKVAVEVTLQAPVGLNPDGAKVRLSVVELFQLKRQNNQWRIVPDENVIKMVSEPQTVEARYDLRPLTTMAALAATPTAAMRNINATRQSALAASCLSNEKQIALGVLMYTQDYDEIFPRKKASYKDLIFPYVKNNAVFQCPSDAKGTISYTFNPNMQGVPLGEVEFPAQTVLVYEGSNMQFQFKHNGRTAVAFVDGHAKLLTPEETARVFWYPGGKTPKPPKTKQPARPVGKRRK